MSLPNLLTVQLSYTSIIFPFAQEQLAEEGVKGFLLVAVFLAPTSVLLLESGQEPFQH